MPINSRPIGTPGIRRSRVLTAHKNKCNHEGTKIRRITKKKNFFFVFLRVFVAPAGETRNDYGSTAVMLRFGTAPTGICRSSFCDATSTTDTELEPAFAT